MPKQWYVYIIRCIDNTLYTGITTDVERRLQEHSKQGLLSAKYLRGKSPLKLVFQLEIPSRSCALKLEHQIKHLSKADKETLIKDPSKLHILLICQER